jgi:heat-inducible transcriptional repressor
MGDRPDFEVKRTIFIGGNRLMPPLDSRKVRIIQAIVTDYVLTIKPVGSERLIEAYEMGCKSATIRNEMAELADLGYITQPHTSAGRIPTDRGYRYYVDELMNPPAALTEQEASEVQTQQSSVRSEIAEIVLHTCRLLSQLTSYPSLASDPSVETTTLNRLYLTPASPRHVLLVALLSNAHVEHCLIELPRVPDDVALTSVSNYLNSVAAGKEIQNVDAVLLNRETPNELRAYSDLIDRVCRALSQSMQALSERRVYFEGMNHILRQPEFKETHRLETLLDALEQRGALYQVLSRALTAGDINILIGTENPLVPMQECSIITKAYSIQGRFAGFLGVVGPTRMNYDRASAAVGLMAHSLSQTLTNLSLA